MIKVGIIDDHQLIRDGFEKLILNQRDMVLNGSYSCADDFKKSSNVSEFDIIILDLCLPDCNGLVFLNQIKEMENSPAVLVLSMHAEEEYALIAMKNGASGYISKGTDSRVILDAIRKIHSTGVYISQSTSELLAKSISGSGGIMPHTNLSNRELQILCLIGQGLKTHQIADKLHISENTVRTYRRRILQKMNMESTAGLIHYAVEHNLSGKV